MRRMTTLGMSLLEVTIAGGLLLFLLGGLSLVLVGGQRYSFQVRSLNDAQTQARVAMKKIVQELENTLSRTVSEANSPQSHLIFVSSADAEETVGATFDGLGRVLWKKWVCFYHQPATSELWRAERVMVAAETSPPLPGTAGYPAFADMQSVPKIKPVARSLIFLDFKVDTALGGGETVRVELATEVNSQTDKATRVQLRSLVYPRN